MAVRSEREKSKMQEKYQLILSQMLKEEDNKYCVDCDTKSPRWASWNIGVFICIRCAGFHRNLGVHISKVKSVNLDSWTPEQIASMQAMCNSRARAVYEANLPDGFRRPQADSALESFIRAKYEQRKWIAKEWIPPEITLIESETNQRRVESPTSDTPRVEKNVTKLKPFTVPASTTNPVRQTIQASSPPPPPPAIISTVENNTQNLLNLDEPSPPSLTNTSSSTTVPSSNILDPLHEVFATTFEVKTEGNTDTSSINKDLESAFSPSKDTETINNGGILSNEKIMALFNTPQTSVATNSGMNTQPSNGIPSIRSSGFAYPPTQHSHLLAHQKSVSFGNNLYQQATNFGSQAHHGHLYPSNSGINHHHLNGMSAPTLQSPTSTFTQEQLNTQFSQFMPFTNTKSNTSTATAAAAFISNIPTSSDSLWQ